MSREQLLVITERYWPDGSGGELATHLIIDILRKEKALEITVITGSRNPMRLPGVRYIYEPLLSVKGKPLLWLNVNRLIRRGEFRKILQESDIVYVPGFMFPIIPYVKSMGKRVIVHLHGYAPVSYTAVILAPYEEHKHKIAHDDIRLECMRDAKHCISAGLLWWLPMLIKKWVSQADKIICVSKRQTNIITDLAPELAGKVEVVYNPLPPELINANINKEIDDVPTFLYVGGESFIKGFHVLLKALPSLVRLGARVRLFGNYRDFQVRNRYVELVGKVPHGVVMRAHEDAWGLLFPSINEEPLPYAVVEAALVGTVPIAARVGGAPEILSGTGAERFMFRAGDAEDLVGRVEELIGLGVKGVMEVGEEVKGVVRRRLEESASRLPEVFMEVLGGD
jgi:glycosyltransferase involved in cell wall biosynthesis